MEIDRQYIRHIVWDYLKRNHATQMGEILRDVKIKIGEGKFHNGVATMVYEEVFGLSSNGLIIFARIFLESAGTDGGFPWISVTEYGKVCFKTDVLMPYDPDGYIRKITGMIQGVDDITIKYLSESIHAFNRQAPVSATITLGVASEQVMLLLIEAYVSSLQNEKERDDLLKKIKGRSIKIQHKEFRKSFERHRSAVPREIIQDIDTAIDTTFRFIKMLRNEQGHPTIVDADKDTVYADLQHFPHYARRMFALISWLKANGTRLSD